MPAPHLQPLGLASLHGRSEWFSHTHSTPWQVGQRDFVMGCDSRAAIAAAQGAVHGPAQSLSSPATLSDSSSMSSMMSSGSPS